VTCTPNSPVCAGELATVCNSAGSGYQPGGTDCYLAGKVCAFGACHDSFADTVGSIPATTGSGFNIMRLNVYRVNKPRTLSQIEAYLTITGATELVWMIYEGTNATGTYARVFSKVTPASVGPAGYVSSGPIVVSLRANRYYAIGQAWVGGVTYHYNTGALPETVSFGQRTSSVADGAPGFPPVAQPTISVFQSSTAYPQRLTTGV
jgi:hypothetical protein